MFEATRSTDTPDPPSEIWARWADPERWPEWDSRVSAADGGEGLTEGADVRVKLKKGGTTVHRVTALEPGRRLVTEYRLPGARVGHDRLVEPRGQGSRVTHRLYVEGALSGFWAWMLGRKQLTETVARFGDAAA